MNVAAILNALRHVDVYMRLSKIQQKHFTCEIRPIIDGNYNSNNNSLNLCHRSSPVLYIGPVSSPEGEPRCLRQIHVQRTSFIGKFVTEDIGGF